MWHVACCFHQLTGGTVIVDRPLFDHAPLAWGALGGAPQGMGVECSPGQRSIELAMGALDAPLAWGTRCGALPTREALIWCSFGSLTESPIAECTWGQNEFEPLGNTLLKNTQQTTGSLRISTDNKTNKFNIDGSTKEFMTILHALRCFSTSSYVGSPLIIESDSKIALTWIEKVGQRPWNKWHIFNEIDVLCISLVMVSFQHAYWEGNAFADSLARYGVDRSSHFSAWW
ncbi:Uncharacterized protein TCM_025947 [Theobroma cacao]|uniref:RNase H type-1 domain-containing protein n=1 Tax=Theobroma cacao TaxID=3641 RepID=A0A061F811_THECC|nr:Uncharacterized protein TCM_025947 [Theobroma cacao]